MPGLSAPAASLLDFTDSISNSFGCQLTFWYRFPCSRISQQLHLSSLPFLKAFSLVHPIPSSRFSFTNVFSLSCCFSCFSLSLHFKSLSPSPWLFAVSIDTQPVGFAQPTERLSFKDRLDLGQTHASCCYWRLNCSVQPSSVFGYCLPVCHICSLSLFCIEKCVAIFMHEAVLGSLLNQ